MLNISVVSTGWINFIKSYTVGLPQAIVDMSQKRIDICKSCPELIFNRVITDKQVSMSCKACGCIFPVFTFSKEKECPIGKWD